MPVFVYVLPIPLLLLISYFALSRHSSPMIKRTALAALILVGLSVLVSLIVVISESSGKAGVIVADIPAEPVAAQTTNIIATVVFGIFMLFFLALIVFLTLQEQRRNVKKEERPKFSDE
jgi:NADH:ubiquinone oxidoreductase subunit 6 (subunit J)